MNSIRRVGVLIPRMNAVVEPDLYSVATKDLAFHFARFVVPKGTGTVENVIESTNYILNETCKMLPNVELVVVGATAPSFIKGVGWDKELSERIEDTIGIPAITASTAVIDALRALKLSNLAVGSSYIPDTQEKLRRFLEDNGFRVVSIQTCRDKIGFGEGTGYLEPGIPYETFFELAEKIDRPDANGILISCTNLRLLGIIEKLEQKHNKPLVTSNQALIWSIFQRLNLNTLNLKLGELMKVQT